MLIPIVSILLFLIFLTLSAFHFYWLAGGIVGLEAVIPTKDENHEISHPPFYATLAVALILLLFSLIYLNANQFISLPLPHWLIKLSYWFIPIIFLLRAIGEFNYVGFFKKVRNTKFAIADTRIFSPICLFISILSSVILIGQ